jgi:hypothetical protein
MYNYWNVYYWKGMWMLMYGTGRQITIQYPGTFHIQNKCGIYSNYLAIG